MSAFRSALFSRWGLLLVIVIAGAVGVALILTSEDNKDVADGRIHRYPTPPPVTFTPPTPLPSATPVPDPLVGSPVPSVSFNTLDGDPIRLADTAGEVIFLNFWASWCEPCKEEMPALQKLQDNFGDQGVQVITITDPEEGQSEEDVRAFLDQYNITLQAGLSSDPDLYRAFGVEQIPTTFIIDQEGIVRFRHIGPLHDDDIAVYLDEVRGEAE